MRYKKIKVKIKDYKILKYFETYDEAKKISQELEKIDIILTANVYLDKKQDKFIIKIYFEL